MATVTGYDFATSCTYFAIASAPVARAFTVCPAKKSAPPVVTCRMPSEPASVSPCSTALIVDEDDTLMAGNANTLRFAVSSISAY